MPTRVTLADVARAAGVSRTTASFVLSGRTDMRISADAQQRVLVAAAELGYRPNLTARSLRQGTTRTIGLVSDTIATTQFAGEVIHGALDAAFDKDHLLFVVETGGDPEVERKLVEEMLDRQVDGVVYATMYTRPASPPRQLEGRPVVALNCLTDTFRGPRVLPDEHQAGRTAARALVDAGFREGVYSIGGRHRIPLSPDGVHAGRERMDGFDEVLASVGAAVEYTVECDWEPERGYQGVHDLLAAGHRPRALVCLNDRLALGAYQALRERGLSVPDDVSVVSFDDSDLASWLRPTLTSVALPHYELGRTAVELLVTGALADTTHLVPMPLRPRASVGTPASTTKH